MLNYEQPYYKFIMSSLESLFEANSRCFSPGLTTEEIISRYSVWASRYDEDMDPKLYKGPEVAANVVASLYKEKDRSQVKILDVAAGTGLVGIHLQELGFKSIDALDPCEDLLKVLKNTGAYKKIYMEYLNDKQSSIPSDTYDVVVVSGGMGQGHIPILGLNEMLRMTKVGGYVCIVMRHEYIDTVDNYKGKFIPHIESMEKNKKWKKVLCDVVEGYFCGKEGLLLVHQKL